MDTNSDIFIMVLGVIAVLLILLAFIVSFLFLYKNRQQQYRRNMDAATEQFNQEILNAQLEIKEQTLKNVSQEIHDNVGQVLSLAVLHLSAVELADTAGATHKIENVTGLVQKAIADLRNLSKTMDADNISVGLVAMIRFELDLLEKTSLYTTSLEIFGEEQRLDGQRELILYRMVQESFNNVMKHARASAITVRLEYGGAGVLFIRISDNGSGFDTTALHTAQIDQRGAGIKNMCSRATLIGAEFGIQSSDAGTVVSILVKY